MIDHLPPDNIPLWDLDLPADYPRRYKDASAAAIFLAGLLELRGYVRFPEKDYAIKKAHE
jgi:hypothetical protein